MQIIQKKQFLKKFDTLTTKIQLKVVATLDLFVKDPFDANIRNHALMGKYRGLRSIDVMGDLRIVFRELSDSKYELVELVNIGSHSQLYG